MLLENLNLLEDLNFQVCRLPPFTANGERLAVTYLEPGVTLEVFDARLERQEEALFP